MFTKTKIGLIATFVIVSASATMAQSLDGSYTPGKYRYSRSPGAPVPIFQQSNRQPSTLIEGRNIGVQGNFDREFEQRWFERASESNDAGSKL